ncbi:MAG: sulfotransferase [Cryomorphaceae bacterium]
MNTASMISRLLPERIKYDPRYWRVFGGIRSVRVAMRRRPKIFCIGMNKTGTTSLRREFERLGYLVGNERQGELLYKEVLQEKYEDLYAYIKTGEVFQDFPFSLPEMVSVLDAKYPDAKFILSVRSSEQQWCESLISFHARRFGDGVRTTVADLKNSNYVEKGMAWKCFSHVFRADENALDPYDPERLTAVYRSHNENVRRQFTGRSHKLLEIDLSKPNAYADFCTFLNINPGRTSFPWENKTKDIL